MSFECQKFFFLNNKIKPITSTDHITNIVYNCYYELGCMIVYYD